MLSYCHRYYVINSYLTFNYYRMNVRIALRMHTVFFIKIYIITYIIDKFRRRVLYINAMYYHNINLILNKIYQNFLEYQNDISCTLEQFVLRNVKNCAHSYFTYLEWVKSTLFRTRCFSKSTFSLLMTMLFNFIDFWIYFK